MQMPLFNSGSSYDYRRTPIPIMPSLEQHISSQDSSIFGSSKSVMLSIQDNDMNLALDDIPPMSRGDSIFSASGISEENSLHRQSSVFSDIIHGRNKQLNESKSEYSRKNSDDFVK